MLQLAGNANHDTNRLRVMLDAALHPHLLDSIIDLAQRNPLLRLRLVRRYVRQRADAALSTTHLILSPSRYGTIVSPGGRLPALRSGAFAPCASSRPCSGRQPGRFRLAQSAPT